MCLMCEFEGSKNAIVKIDDNTARQKYPRPGETILFDKSDVRRYFENYTPESVTDEQIEFVWGKFQEELAAGKENGRVVPMGKKIETVNIEITNQKPQPSEETTGRVYFRDELVRKDGKKNIWPKCIVTTPDGREGEAVKVKGKIGYYRVK